MIRRRIRTFNEFKRFAHRMLDDKSLCIGFGKWCKKNSMFRIKNQFYALVSDLAFFDHFDDFNIIENHQELEEKLKECEYEILEHMDDVKYYKFF